MRSICGHSTVNSAIVSSMYHFFKELFILDSSADINECALGMDTCGEYERCENSFGSFVCRRIMSCGTGYTMDAASQNCVGKTSGAK